MRFFSAKCSTSVVIAKCLLLTLCFATRTTLAQNDAADIDSEGDSTALDIPSTLQALSTECPMELARISPCIDTNADLTSCTECVSTFILQNGDVLNANAPQEERQQELNSNSTSGTDADKSTSTTSCDAIQEALCQGIQQCGSSCGLVNEDSFFTFGSDCETLFENLVACVLQSQNIGTDCNFQDTSCLDGQVVDSNAANSMARRETTIMSTSLLMGMMIVFLWM
jgi:predicted nucleic acid binding AN1-type Zn finger protein